MGKKKATESPKVITPVDVVQKNNPLVKGIANISEKWHQRWPEIDRPWPVEGTMNPDVIKIMQVLVSTYKAGQKKGKNATCNNYFTSYQLARQLLERNVTVVGTVQKNKPELPPRLLAVKGRAVFSSVFSFTPAATLVSYVRRKKNRNVVLLSTRHSEAEVSDRADDKPVVVLDYNRNKGGVDNLDKVIGTYSCRRKTARWSLVVFHNILDVSSYNAFVIWREVNHDWMPGKRNKRRVFLEQRGKALVAPYIVKVGRP